MYFITICTRDRFCYFGDIKNGKMTHFSAGAIAHPGWYDISRNSNTIYFGELATMTNHMHGIIILSGNQSGILVGTVTLVVRQYRVSIL